MAQTCLSVSTIYRFMRAGSFPKPNHSPGRRSVWWDAESVQEWIKANNAATSAESNL